jgi:ABC transport system ATP-binding/permease protein
MNQALERIRLHHVEGPRAGQVDDYCQPAIVVGRAPDCHLVFAAERGVSGHHAEIRQSGAGFELVDTNSTNGTFVGDERVTARALKPGDQIRFGYMGPLVRVDFDVLAQPMQPHPGVDAADASSTMMFSAKRINEAANAVPPPEVTLPPPSRTPARVDSTPPPRMAPPPQRAAPPPPVRAPAPPPRPAIVAELPGDSGLPYVPSPPRQEHRLRNWVIAIAVCIGLGGIGALGAWLVSR